MLFYTPQEKRVSQQNTAVHRENRKLILILDYICRAIPNLLIGFDLKSAMFSKKCFYMKNVLFFVVLFSTCFLVSAKISKTERKALIAFYESTNGPEWVHTWNLEEPEAQWYGVKVVDNHVVEINLFRNNLKGVIPASIGNLEHLKVFNVAFNTLTGELPASIARLEDLEILKIEMNRFKGALPESFGSLTKLKELTAFNNFFSGNIPASLGQLTKLKVLNLSSNNLKGAIPEALGNLSNLESLGLFENTLEGAIPREFGQLVQLKELILANNQLDGEIPREFSQLASLEILQIQNNKFNSLKNLENMNTRQFLVFDYDKGDMKLNFKEIDFKKTRVAETKFDDDNDNE